MSFRLLSMFSDCSRMTMTGHPLTTTHTLLWTNYYVSTLQNKRQRVGELIQSNEKPVLPDKPPGLPHSPQYEKWQPFVKPPIWRLGRHVTICLRRVHCGGPVAQAKVSCIINSACPWHCVSCWVLSFPFFVCTFGRKSEKYQDQNKTSVGRTVFFSKVVKEVITFRSKDYFLDVVQTRDHRALCIFLCCCLCVCLWTSVSAIVERGSTPSSTSRPTASHQSPRLAKGEPAECPAAATQPGYEDTETEI